MVTLHGEVGGLEKRMGATPGQEGAPYPAFPETEGTRGGPEDLGAKVQTRTIPTACGLIPRIQPAPQVPTLPGETGLDRTDRDVKIGGEGLETPIVDQPVPEQASRLHTLPAEQLAGEISIGCVDVW
jgi:hypothetical protein